MARLLVGGNGAICYSLPEPAPGYSGKHIRRFLPIKILQNAAKRRLIPATDDSSLLCTSIQT